MEKSLAFLPAVRVLLKVSNLPFDNCISNHFFNIYFCHYTYIYAHNRALPTGICTHVCIWLQVSAAPFFFELATICHSRRATSSSTVARGLRCWTSQNLDRICNTRWSFSATNPEIKRFTLLLLFLLTWSRVRISSYLPEDGILLRRYLEIKSRYTFIHLRKNELFYASYNHANVQSYGTHHAIAHCIRWAYILFFTQRIPIHIKTFTWDVRSILLI